jgi:hypothetical protein
LFIPLIDTVHHSHFPRITTCSGARARPWVGNPGEAWYTRCIGCANEWIRRNWRIDKWFKRRKGRECLEDRCSRRGTTLWVTYLIFTRSRLCSTATVVSDHCIAPLNVFTYNLPQAYATTAVGGALGPLRDLPFIRPGRWC